MSVADKINSIGAGCSQMEGSVGFLSISLLVGVFGLVLLFSCVFVYVFVYVSSTTTTTTTTTILT